MAAATPSGLDLDLTSPLAHTQTPSEAPSQSQSQDIPPADHAPASADPIDTVPSPQRPQDQERQERPDQPPASLANSISDLTSAYPRLEQSQSAPYTSFSAAVSTSSSPGPASPRLGQPSVSAAGPSSGFPFGGLISRSSSASRVRRPSTQDRINDILETARQRAETVSAQASGTETPNASPYATLARHTTFRMEPLLRDQFAQGAFLPESAGDDGRALSDRGSQRSARHLHYAANTGTYGTLGTSASRSSSGRPRSRRNADHGYQQEAAAVASGVSGVASGAASARPSRAASRAASVLGGGGGGGGGGPVEQPWWKDWLSGFQSIELENKGSVARDHLALERTFLAWLRTSLAFASIGIAVTQLFRLNTSASSGSEEPEQKLTRLRHIGRPLGSTFLGISVLILFLGYHRFYQSQQWILKGKFPASRGTILLVSLVAFALMVTSLVIVVVIQPNDG